MPRKRRHAAVFLFAVLPTLVLAGARFSPPLAGRQSKPEPELAVLLDVMGRVAGLYRDNALSFTCEERVTDTRYTVQNRVVQRTTYRFDYFYVFEEAPGTNVTGATDPTAAGVEAPPTDAVAGRLQDYRTGRDSQDDGAARRVELGDVGLPAYLERAYSWVFVFQPGLRELFDFELEGREQIDGQAAFVVRFDPRAPYRPGLNDWFGRAWIDVDRYQLLRVEAVQSQEALAALRAADTGPVGTRDAAVEAGAPAATSPEERPPEGQLFSWARVDFEQDTNGMRFPSQATLIAAAVWLTPASEESYRAAAARILRDGIDHDRLFRVQHRYSDYRFFSVRTATEIDLALARPQ